MPSHQKTELWVQVRCKRHKSVFPRLDVTPSIMVPSADPGALAVSGYKQHMKGNAFYMPYILFLQGYMF